MSIYTLNFMLVLLFTGNGPMFQCIPSSTSLSLQETLLLLDHVSFGKESLSDRDGTIEMLLQQQVHLGVCW